MKRDFLVTTKIPPGRRINVGERVTMDLPLWIRQGLKFNLAGPVEFLIAGVGENEIRLQRP